MENPIVMRVIERMESLPTDLQQLVLEFVQTLHSSTQTGVSGQVMRQFAGTIAGDELERMRRAIMNDCEQVQLNEW
jgi:hypothetical protein